MASPNSTKADSRYRIGGWSAKSSQDAADFSDTNDSDCLSMKVKAKKTVDREITVAHPVIGSVNSAVESHDEG
jgi:hypothetical protein